MLPLRSRRHATPTSGHEANAEGQQRSFPQSNWTGTLSYTNKYRPGPCGLAKHGQIPHHGSTCSGGSSGDRT